MLGVLIVGFLAGMLAANGVPHFVKGITGESHATPFGKPASASQNVIWGWLNLAASAILWHLVPIRIHPRAAFVGISLGVLFAGLGLANSWRKHPKSR